MSRYGYAGVDRTRTGPGCPAYTINYQLQAASPRAGFMTHVTCRLTAENRDQLRNPTLGDHRVWVYWVTCNFTRNMHRKFSEVWT